MSFVLFWLKPNKNEEHTEALRHQRDEAKVLYLNTKKEKNKNIWKTLSQELVESYKYDKLQYNKYLCEEAINASRTNDIKKVFQIVNRIAGKFPTKSATLINKLDGSPHDSKEELLRTCNSYYSGIYNNQEIINLINPVVLNPIIVELPIYSGEITLDEIKDVINHIALHKAAGIDYVVTSEALKYGGPDCLIMLLDIFNKVYNNGIPPSQWKTNMMFLRHKKNDKADLENYRGITLMSVAVKIYNRILLNRIYDQVNEILSPNQAGFRKRMNCTQQIDTIKRILEGAIAKNLNYVAIFVDLSKGLIR